MAKSTGYPCCDGVKVEKAQWNSEATCFYGCKTPVCVNVSPEVTCIPEWSFFIVNSDGIAEALTADNCDDIPCCQLFFTVCKIKPKICRQEWVYKEVKISGHCVCFPEGVAKEKMELLAMRAGSTIVWPHIN